jgi:hypothetical protein
LTLLFVEMALLLTESSFIFERIPDSGLQLQVAAAQCALVSTACGSGRVSLSDE